MSACTDTSLHVINWNTYHLFDHRKHVKKAATWLADRAPDLVALQEVKHVDARALHKLARSWGHQHVAMHKESGYPVALTSSRAITVVERREQGFHHGYLHARTHALDVFVVHFWPNKVSEAEHIVRRAQAMLAEGRRVLMVGDFNAEIRHDANYLHHHGHLGTVIDGKRSFDYRITDAFLAAGFVDLVHEHAPGITYTFGSPALIPRWRKDMRDVATARRRIDFVFADLATANNAITATVDTDDQSVGQWSDHYPITVRLAR